MMDIHLDRPAMWIFENSNVRGPLGYATGYEIMPGAAAASLLDPEDGAQRVGAFALAEGSADSALVSYLLANRNGATWIVATTSANSAGSIELAAGAPVMAMGGFSGGDPAPTLAQLQAYVASGQLRYVLIGGGAGGGPGGGPPGFGGGGPNGGSTSSGIEAWVTSVGTVVDYGGSAGTLYDLSGAMTAGG